jgi:hypothetical protein
MRARWIGMVAVGLLAVLIAMVVADPADAQRRRRRRRGAEPAPVVVPDAGVAPAVTTPDPVGDNPFDDPAPPAANPAQPQQPPGTGAGTGAGAAEGAGQGVADETAEEAAAEGPDLSAIRDEYTSIMDDLVQARSRVAVLGRQLFQTRVRVIVQNRAGDDQTLARVALQLDGAPIHRGDGTSIGGDDGRRVFDGFAAPGPHVITVEVEQRARANDAYRYTLRDAYRFEVPRGKLTEITVVLDDDSEIAEDFPDDQEGEYDVRTRVRVATRDLEAR